MEKKSMTRDHAGRVIGREIIEKESLRREASGRHLGGIWEASGKHLGCIWVCPSGALGFGRLGSRAPHETCVTAFFCKLLALSLGAIAQKLETMP
jgi:hypothetical protein